MPFCGFSQKVGATWPLPESASSRLLAMSDWVMPSCSARVRSVWTSSSGRLNDLLDAQIRESRHVPQRLEQPVGDARFFGLGPMTCTSIGAGAPKLRIWLTMSAGRNAKLVPGNSLRQRGAQPRHVPRGGRVAGLQADEDVRIAAADGARVVVGHVDARDRQADVVDHARDLAGRNHPADRRLDAIDRARRVLHPHARSGRARAA